MLRKVIFSILLIFSLFEIAAQRSEFDYYKVIGTYIDKDSHKTLEKVHESLQHGSIEFIGQRIFVKGQGKEIMYDIVETDHQKDGLVTHVLWNTGETLLMIWKDNGDKIALVTTEPDEKQRLMVIKYHL